MPTVTSGTESPMLRLPLMAVVTVMEGCQALVPLTCVETCTKRKVSPSLEISLIRVTLLMAYFII